MGTCDGTCSNPGAPGGCGECSGTCNGTCDGICSSTTCGGVCVGDVSACDNWEDQNCSGALAPDECTDLFCGSLCAFDAEIGAECSRAGAIVLDPGPASQQALSAVQMSAAPLNDVSLEGESLIDAASYLSLGVQEIAQEASQDPKQIGCYSAGVTAFSEAVTTLSSAVTGAEYALGAGYLGGGDGAGGAGG